MTIETNDRKILRDVTAYYTDKLHEHGATPKGVDWNGHESHELRHRQFDRLIGTDPNTSVIDLGCGFGDYYRYLRAHGHHGHFTGYDVASNMIDAVRALHGDGDDRQWRVGTTPMEPADYVIASGIFNVRGDVPLDEWTAYVERTIGVLANAGSRGFAFNVLSLSSDPGKRRSYLYYADPVTMLAHCLTTYGRSVALMQDYGLYEFTMIVRRD